MKLKRLFLLLAIVAVSACVDDSTDGTSGDDDELSFDFTAMFANMADNIILPNYEAVMTAATTFAGDSGSIATYCNALGGPDEAVARTTAQTAWRQIMDDWQRAEQHLLGPVLDNNSALRNRVLSYNTGALSTCGIDQAVVQAQAAGFTVTTKSFNQRGLGAVEYLLFNNDLSHTCPSQITETTDWNARPVLERQQWRCEYALLLAADIESATTALYNAWLPSAGNYRSSFVNPEETKDGLDALTDAIFYLDTDVKDTKLGLPTGIASACSDFSCPTRVESPYSEHSLNNIQTNLESFLTLFNGGDGLGFDDLIVAAGFADVSTEFVEQTEAAIAFINTINDSLIAQANAIDSTAEEDECSNAAANPGTASSFMACDLYGLVKRITDDLKTDFVTIVNVDLPDRAQSDND